MTVNPIPPLSAAAARILAIAGLASVGRQPDAAEVLGKIAVGGAPGAGDGEAEGAPAPAPQRPGVQAPGQPLPSAAATRRPPPATPPLQLPPQLAQAAGQAAQRAVVRQASPAPLMADLARAAEAPELPPKLRQAARAVAAFQTRPETLATPQGLRQALARSGLFLEARLARAPAVPPEPATDLKAALIALRSALAPLAAEVRRPPEPPRASGRTPAPAQGAPPQPASPAAPPRTGPVAPPPPGAASPTGAPTAGPPAAGPPPAAAQAAAPVGSAPTAPTAPSAPAPTAAAASPPPAGPGPPPGSPSPATAAPAAAPTTLAAAAHAAAPAAPKAPNDPPPAAAAPSAAALASPPERPRAEADAASRPSPQPAQPPAGPRPAPPPMAGAPPSAQPPAPPSLAPHAEPAVVARALAPQVEAAIARQELHQIASLPTQAQPDEPPTARLSFEVPLMTPQGPAVAGFEIRREAPERESDGAAVAAPVWRVSFALDLEPIGLVEAQVTLKDARAGVTLWAERPGSAERLAAGGEALVQALSRASFEPELAVRAGRAPRPATLPGRFLDQAT